MEMGSFGLPRFRHRRRQRVLHGQKSNKLDPANRIEHQQTDVRRADIAWQFAALAVPPEIVLEERMPLLPPARRNWQARIPQEDLHQSARKNSGLEDPTSPAHSRHQVHNSPSDVPFADIAKGTSLGERSEEHTSE